MNGRILRYEAEMMRIRRRRGESLCSPWGGMGRNGNKERGQARGPAPTDIARWLNDEENPKNWDTKL